MKNIKDALNILKQEKKLIESGNRDQKRTVTWLENAIEILEDETSKLYDYRAYFEDCTYPLKFKAINDEVEIIFSDEDVFEHPANKVYRGLIADYIVMGQNKAHIENIVSKEKFIKDFKFKYLCITGLDVSHFMSDDSIFELWYTWIIDYVNAVLDSIAKIKIY